jgi:cell division protein FtsI (penicillin-binding protein 3)
MGIDLAGEGYPEVHRPGQKIWNPTTVAWMAFGYNVQITPLQTLCLYNAIANGGKMMKPYLVSAISKEGKIIRTIQPTVLREQLCSSATLQQLNNCLQGVCLRGTAAQVFKNTPYPVAGKTGTAQVANRNQGYNTNIYQASFAGFFPADHPKYTCVVVIKNKAGAILHHGSDVAAPVFKEIADRLYSTYLRKSPATLLVNNAPADSIQCQLAGNKNDLQIEFPFEETSKEEDHLCEVRFYFPP